MAQPKRKRSKEDTEKLLAEQITFMLRSAELYDSGELAEGKRLATSIRILVHDTKNSKSLLGQLGLKKISFWSIRNFRPEILGFTYSGLTLLQKDSINAPWRYVPAFDGIRMSIRKKLFPDWWNETVVIDNKKRAFCRRKIVLSVANTDGGAHVDPDIDEAFWDFSREDSLGTIIVNDEAVKCENPELACIRQITYELLKTLKEKRPDYFPRR